MRVVDVPLGPAGVAGCAIDMHELEEARAELKHLIQANRDMLDRLSAGVAQFGPNQKPQCRNQPFRASSVSNPKRPRSTQISIASSTPCATRDWCRKRRTSRPGARRGGNGSCRPTPWRRTGSCVTACTCASMRSRCPTAVCCSLFEDRREHVQLASSRDTLLRVRNATLDNLFEADRGLRRRRPPAPLEQQVPPDLVRCRRRCSRSIRAWTRLMAGALRSAVPSTAGEGLVHQLDSGGDGRAPPARRPHRLRRRAPISSSPRSRFPMGTPCSSCSTFPTAAASSRRCATATRRSRMPIARQDRVRLEHELHELRTPLTSSCRFCGDDAGRLRRRVAGPVRSRLCQCHHRQHEQAFETDRECARPDTGRTAGGVADRAQAARHGSARPRDRYEFRGSRQGAGDQSHPGCRRQPGSIRGDERRIRQIRRAPSIEKRGQVMLEREGRVLIQKGGNQHGVRVALFPTMAPSGIGAKLQPRIFDTFLLAHFSRTADGRSSGLERCRSRPPVQLGRTGGGVRLRRITLGSERTMASR